MENCDEDDVNGPNDIYIQVIGADKGKYVWGYGLGPSSKDLWGKKQTKFQLRKLYSAEKKKWEEEIEKQNRKIDRMNGHIGLICKWIESKFEREKIVEELKFLSQVRTKFCTIIKKVWFRWLINEITQTIIWFYYSLQHIYVT